MACRDVVMMLVLASCADERVLSVPCDGDCAPTTKIHPAGILDPASPDFHGRELERRNWDFPLCAGCHGADFSGGVAKVSCLGCHVAGPTACSTCHGTGPTSNAHSAHAPTVACGECHVTPTSWDDDGHILHDGVAITTPPAIVFGTLAGAAMWDGATCTNVYCHGVTLHGGSLTQPRWDDPTPPGGCGTCHGDPPPSHTRSDCASCHPRSALHIDGIVQLGTSCTGGCHGTASSAAPPLDLAGNMFTTALGVGAHQAHLQGLSRIAAPIPCATCHLVPSDVGSPGHIDTPPPAEVVAAVGWDRVAQTCTASCHGPARPRWTSSGEVSCGTCHGIPPMDASHTPLMTLASCAGCHPGTVDAFGNIIVTNGRSEHINGIVDLQ